MFKKMKQKQRQMPHGGDHTNFLDTECEGKVGNTGLTVMKSRTVSHMQSAPRQTQFSCLVYKITM